LHSHLTSSVANQSLALVGKNFREFDEILGEISKKGSRGNIESLVGLRKVYEQAVNDHTQLVYRQLFTMMLNGIIGLMIMF
jgi:hypothetical protein